jgi:hypothetical protein
MLGLAIASECVREAVQRQFPLGRRLHRVAMMERAFAGLSSVAQSFRASAEWSRLGAPGMNDSAVRVPDGEDFRFLARELIP